MTRGSRLHLYTSRARESALPTDTVRVKSTQYESYTPPKSSTTRSPSANFRSSGRAWGSAGGSAAELVL